jgi:hypothetical protein
METKLLENNNFTLLPEDNLNALLNFDFKDKGPLVSKTCNGISNRIIEANSNMMPTIHTHTIPVLNNVQVNPQVNPHVNVQIASGIDNSVLDQLVTSTDSSIYYNIFGYKLSTWMLILGIIILITIIYLLYKYFTSENVPIVHITKSDEINKNLSFDNDNKSESSESSKSSKSSESSKSSKSSESSKSSKSSEVSKLKE